MATELERPTHYVSVQVDTGYWLKESSTYLFFGKNMEEQLEDFRKEWFARGARTCSIYPYEISYRSHPDVGVLGTLTGVGGSMFDKKYTTNVPADKTTPYRFLRYKEHNNYYNFLVLRASRLDSEVLIHRTQGLPLSKLVKNVQFLPEPGLNFISGYRYNPNQPLTP